MHRKQEEQQDLPNLLHLARRTNRKTQPMHRSTSRQRLKHLSKWRRLFLFSFSWLILRLRKSLLWGNQLRREAWDRPQMGVCPCTSEALFYWREKGKLWIVRVVSTWGLLEVVYWRLDCSTPNCNLQQMSAKNVVNLQNSASQQNVKSEFLRGGILAKHCSFPSCSPKMEWWNH